MTLIELPSNTGKIIAINPHHVSAVQAYSGYCTGVLGKKDMSAVWINGHNIYVCAWDVETVTLVLNKARHDDAALFAAGFHAGKVAAAWTTEMPDDVSAWLAAAWANYLEKPE